MNVHPTGKGETVGASDPEDFLRGPIAPWWAGPLFLFLAVALVPWIIYLGLTLPTHTQANHYRTAWVGFDVLLVIVLARTAWLAIQGKRQMEVPAAISATLLVVDAWFDIMMSRPGAAQMEAVFLAVFVELPAAFLAIYLSRRVDQVVDQTLELAATRRSRFRSQFSRRLVSPGGRASDDEAAR